MRRIYRVIFLDVADNCHNEKLLEAECADDIYAYMEHFGHSVLAVDEVVSKR